LPSCRNSDRWCGLHLLRRGEAASCEQSDATSEHREERCCMSRQSVLYWNAWRLQRPPRLSAFRSTQHPRIVALKSKPSRCGHWTVGCIETCMREKHRGRPGTLVGRGKF
jgi:hypothetical protein